MYSMETAPAVSRPVLIAGFASFVFFALEAVLLVALDVTTSYFQAQMIIATSLFGMLLGTVVPAMLPKNRCVAYLPWLLQTVWILPLVSLGLVLISFSYPLLSIIGLIGVFAPLGFVVSVLYWFASPWRLYASELLGAVGGLGFFILLIPSVRSENALIALAAIAAAFVLGLLWRQLTWPTVVLFGAISIACTTGLVSNVFNHHINLLLHTVCHIEVTTGYSNNKVACLDDQGVPYQLEVSFGSLQNRIDIFRTSTDGYYFTAYSGTRNDIIQPFPADHYEQDARIPSGIVDDPNTLILGAGAEGVAKVAKSMGASDITVVEYNPAVLHVWDENLPYADIAFRPLANTSVVQGDARLFVQNTDESYDIITLMNTHRSLHAAQFGYPDFLHTKEALADYFAALSSEGFLSIEEVSFKNEGDADIARRLQTMLDTLNAQGIDNPRDHMLVYQWLGAEKDQPIPDGSDLLYTQILVSKHPWTKEQLATFRRWANKSQQTDEFQRPANMTFYRPIWYPDTGIGDTVSGSSLLTQSFRIDGQQSAILTDTAPFSTTLGEQDKYVLYIFLGISSAALLSFLVWYRRRAVDVSSGWVGYFFLTGAGYMAVEMFLLLWLQLYLGSIFITMVVVIGGLFVSSALASLYYQAQAFSTRALVLRCMLAAVLLVGVYVVPWPALSFVARVLVSLGVTIEVGILLAPLFPYAMHLVEARAKHATPILVGMNGVALAVGVPISILVATYFGFTALLVLAASLYAAALAILYVVR